MITILVLTMCVNSFSLILIEEQIDFVELIRQNTNYKEQLSRLFQDKWGEYPVYEMISMQELPGGKEFTMGVYDPTGNCPLRQFHRVVLRKKVEQHGMAHIAINEWNDKKDIPSNLNEFKNKIVYRLS